MRIVPSSDALDAESDERHLTEYQQSALSELRRHTGTKLLILATSGPHTLAYANEFRQVMQSQSVGWTVDGPHPVPKGNERMIDVQVSAENLRPPRQEALALVSVLKKAGIKCRNGLTYDPAVSPNLVVLWIGPKSPDGMSPDDCLPAELRPRAGQHHGCEMVNQTPRARNFQVFMAANPPTE